MGKKYIVYSDHKPLENMNVKAMIDEELGNLMHYLSQYNFKVQPRKDKPRSRPFKPKSIVLEPYENTDNFFKVVNLINLNDIKNDQHKNLDLQNRKLILKNEIYYKKNKKKNECCHGRPGKT